MDNLMIQATNLIAVETKRVETAGQNIANMATPGYKRQIPYVDVMASTGGRMASGAVGNSQLMIATDFSAGKLLHTNNPLDLAITGPGFFEVMTPNGPAYTRYGAFQRDGNGRLVNTQGFAVQASGGGDVTLRSDNWRIEHDGTVVDDGHPSSAIRVVSFDSTASLQRSANGLFTSSSLEPMDGEQVQLTTGYVESSNVQNGPDMVLIMESMRRIESGQKIVHVYDDMMGSAIQRLGDM